MGTLLLKLADVTYYLDYIIPEQKYLDHNSMQWRQMSWYDSSRPIWYFAEAKAQADKAKASKFIFSFFIYESISESIWKGQ